MNHTVDGMGDRRPLWLLESWPVTNFPLREVRHVDGGSCLHVHYTNDP